ncbi:sensor histidine kinase [Kitasatospora sp. NPDC059571]|uniref:sensor histidine kinase n=1 Tax=Kitasatospora sp. NPDC059571 TaxID=3346871 RepID=UPI0036742045
MTSNVKDLIPPAPPGVRWRAGASLAPRVLLRRVLPGPWRGRAVLAEAVLALLVGALVGAVVTGSGGPWRGAGAGAFAAVLVLLRRGLPVPVLLLAAAGAGADGGFLPVLVVAAWTAGRLVERPAVLAAAFGTALAVTVGLSQWLDSDGISPLANAVVSVVGFMLLAVLPALVGRYRAQRRALLDALRERNGQLLREREMIARQARLRERHRIAQDMHDSLGHRLALISVHTGALEVDRSLTDHQREAVGVLREAAAGAMRELREVVFLLREDTATEAGGVEAVERLAAASRAAGADVTVRHGGSPRPIAAAAGHAAYRIVQEGLTNAHKHAPAAPIAVALRYEPDALLVEVVNGPPPQSSPGAIGGGQGLTGLRERARLLGGMVHAAATPDGGFRLAGVLPYDGVGPATGLEQAADLDLLPPVPPDPASRRSPAVGCALGAGLVLLTTLGGLAWGGFGIVRSVHDATLERGTFDAMLIGTPEDEIRTRLPRGSDLMTSDYRSLGPPVPPGAACDWFISGEGTGVMETETVLRLCFRDGRLVEKQHYSARG